MVAPTKINFASSIMRAMTFKSFSECADLSRDETSSGSAGTVEDAIHEFADHSADHLISSGAWGDRRTRDPGRRFFFR